eukprot:EG_transcript_11482
MTQGESSGPIRLIFVAAAADYVGVSAMRTLLPFIAGRLSQGSVGAVVGGMESAYGAGQVVGALLLGPISDRVGRRPILLLSCLGSAVGYGAAGLVGSASGLLLSRLVVGLSKQTITVARAAVADCTAADSARSVYMNRLSAVAALGYAIGPYLAGRAADAVGDGFVVLAIATGFAILTLSLAAALPETRKTPTSTNGKGADGPLPRGLIAALCLPEAALIAHTSTAFAALLQHYVPDGRALLGGCTSATALSSTAISWALLPWLTSAGYCAEPVLLQSGCAALVLTSGCLLWSPSPASFLISTVPTAYALAVFRGCAAAAVSRAAGPGRQGAALGALDLASSGCRLVAPLLAGLLFDRVGPAAPLCLNVVLCLAGGLALGGQADWSRRKAPVE